jgi:hypothetical protein
MDKIREIIHTNEYIEIDIISFNDNNILKLKTENKKEFKFSLNPQILQLLKSEYPSLLHL